MIETEGLDSCTGVSPYNGLAHFSLIAARRVPCPFAFSGAKYIPETSRPFGVEVSTL